MSGSDALDLHGSRILIGTGLLDRCGPELRRALGTRRLAIVTDDTVAPLWGDRLAAATGDTSTPRFVMPAGEANKTRKTWSRITDELLDAGFGRDTALLALGGGVVGDLTGFVAATYLRGIPFVQIPTTLLAMIDASIGGKTGVDTRAGKNLVGAFHHPALVIADTATLGTLPAVQLRNGLAEAVKHAVIASPSEFTWLDTHAAELTQEGGPSTAVAERLVRTHVTLKAEVVARDERESGLRKILNFGHTVGHAIESLSHYELLHGECVALGMIVEARAAELAGIGEAGLTETIAALLTSVGLPTEVPRQFDADAILAATRTDKKAREGRVEYALPVRIGVMAGADRAYGTPLSEEVVRAALNATFSA